MLSDKKIDEYIRENREAFDDEVPSLSVWANIDDSLAQTQKRRVRTLTWRVAASIAACMVIGLGVTFAFQNKNRADAIIASQHPEFFEMETYYKELIQNRSVKLAGYKPNSPILNDIAKLDETLAALKIALEEAPKESEGLIISKMIEIYKLKVEVLENVLEQIETRNPTLTKTKKDETLI